MRRRAHEGDGLQNVADILRILPPGIENLYQRFTIEQCFCRLRVAFADGVETGFVSAVVTLGLAGEVQERVGHAAHRRYDHADAVAGTLDHEAGDALETVCVREARAPEFVNFPAIFRQLPVRPLRKTLHDND